MKQRKENRANKGKLHEYATLRGCGLDGRITASSRGSVNWHTKEILKPPTTTFKDSAVRLVFIIDPIQNLDPTHDTSVALMEAAQALGHQVWVTQANLLSVVAGKAVLERVQLKPVQLVEGRWVAEAAWYQLSDRTFSPSGSYGRWFMRTRQ